jgi:hypothetical protein
LKATAMRYVRLGLFALTLWCSLTTAARAVPPYDSGIWTEIAITKHPLAASSAPVDEYFGPQRLSNLGMRNMLHFMMLEGTSPLALPGQMANIEGLSAGLAEWADKYPRDRWLPDSMLKFSEFLQSKARPFTDAAAVGYLLLLEDRYAGTAAGREAAKIVQTYHHTPDFDITELPIVSERATAGGLPRRLR